MTDEMQEMLKDRLNKAREKKDPELICEALASMGTATMQCQVKSGDRIKRMEADLVAVRANTDAIQRGMTEIATSRAQLTEDYRQVSKGLSDVQLTLRDWQNQAKGGIKVAGWVKGGLIALASSGGTGALIALIEFLKNVH